MVGVVITIRLIRDFEHRNIKLMVMRDVDLSCSGAELKTNILKRIAEESAFVTLRRSDLTTLKIHQLSAHQYKDQNLVVNLDRDDWVIEDGDRLQDKGVRAEAEISFYNNDAYQSFKQNPVVKW
uniref:Uncharacterized protein n=1 Tax=Rhodosorus marinus TaxID=101924 RepID=A0A7S0BJJ2_9RHOD|mmetsp:Transcript_18769/g.27129  ORF Transcript_18769/g.27129 Transcript_18769/m.27129 type:complete len:124 (+) Transcript_18769:47-418(+)